MERRVDLGAIGDVEHGAVGEERRVERDHGVAADGGLALELGLEPSRRLVERWRERDGAPCRQRRREGRSAAVDELARSSSRSRRQVNGDDKGCAGSPIVRGFAERADRLPSAPRGGRCTSIPRRDGAAVRVPRRRRWPRGAARAASRRPAGASRRRRTARRAPSRPWSLQLARVIGRTAFELSAALMSAHRQAALPWYPA